MLLLMWQGSDAAGDLSAFKRDIRPNGTVCVIKGAMGRMSRSGRAEVLVPAA